MSGRITFAVMRIAVNARCLSDTSKGAGYWTFHLFRQLVPQHPEHEFLFLTDVPLQIEFGSNASFEVIGQPVKNLLQGRSWLDLKFARYVEGVNIIVSLDSTGSLRTGIPQLIGVTDLTFLQKDSFLTRILEKRRFSKLLKKADRVVSISAYAKQDIISQFAVSESKVSVTPKAPSDIYEPLEWQQKETVKECYSDGKEFFLFTGGFDPDKNLLTILKGFSRFKKWQQSNMKLLIAGDTTNDPANLKQMIATFKFRNDVVVMEQLPPADLHVIMAAAYAIIYTPLKQTFGMPVLEAMRSGTPVMCSATVATEVSGDAVLYVDAGDEADIGHQMIKIYQDEALRSRLVESGLQQSSRFNWQMIADEMWKLIEETATQRTGV